MKEPQKREKRYVKIDINSLFISIISVLSVLVLILSYFVFDGKNGEKNEESSQNKTKIENNQENQNKAEMNVTSATDSTVAELVEKVFKHIFLPSGDVRIETIVDVERLQANNPIFYQFAHDGDKILLYSDRAILYNPEVDKVLDVYHILNK